MINSISVPVQSVNSGQNVLFTTDRCRTNSCKCGGWLIHDNGSGLFTISKQGIYEVEYNANITSTTAGAISLVLELNGEAIGGTNAIYNVTTADDVGHVSASTLVCVPCGCCVTISLGNNSANAISVQDANIIIKKIA